MTNQDKPKKENPIKKWANEPRGKQPARPTPSNKPPKDNPIKKWKRGE